MEDTDEQIMFWKKSSFQKRWLCSRGEVLGRRKCGISSSLPGLEGNGWRVSGTCRAAKERKTPPGGLEMLDPQCGPRPPSSHHPRGLLLHVLLHRVCSWHTCECNSLAFWGKGLPQVGNVIFISRNWASIPCELGVLSPRGLQNGLLENLPGREDH